MGGSEIVRTATQPRGCADRGCWPRLCTPAIASDARGSAMPAAERVATAWRRGGLTLPCRDGEGLHSEQRAVVDVGAGAETGPDVPAVGAGRE
jgi:hypothetical protein